MEMTGTCRARWWGALLSLAFFLLCSSTPAQALAAAAQAEELSPAVYLEEADNTVRSHLARITAFLADRQWDEAVETLRRVMENDGEKLMRVEPEQDGSAGEFARYLPVRQYGHLQLVHWHRSAPAALELYRSRVDPLAQRWYQQGIAQRDTALLQRVVDQLFVSRFGDDALLRLGEIALERGDYTAAREAWERISPLLRMPENSHPLLSDVAGRPLWLALRGFELEAVWEELEPLLTEAAAQRSWLAYPDTSLSLAEVRARLVLVSILEGSWERAGWELDLLGRLHPEAEGQLGGRQGRYVELLGALLEQSRRWPPRPASPDWNTFGGDFTRQQRVAEELDPGGPPIWQIELPQRSAEQEQLSADRPRVAEDRGGLLSYHPLVVGGQVLIGKGTQVEDIEAVDLHTGERLWPAGPSRDEQELAGWRRQGTYRGVPRFTLTADGDRLLARLGSPQTGGRADDGRRGPQRSQLVAVDLQAQRRRLFTIGLEGPDWGPQWSFEGTPVSDGSSLYVALRRRDEVRAQSHVACFDLQRGQLRWRQLISTAETPGPGVGEEVSHNLLTLRQGVLYYNTNAGAVAALRAADGSVKWITQYPRSVFASGDPDRADQHFFRDLNPCLLYNDLVIVAPADCDRLFALDAASGQAVWSGRQQQAADAVHLLGVGQENLIVSGDYLYWFDVYSGRVVGQYPAAGQNAAGYARPSPRGFGRGLLAGDRVYWPTREKIYVFEQRTLRTETGWRPVGVREIELTHRGATGGNLLMAHGVLLIATPDRLIAFNASGRPGRVSEPAAGRR